ncbi:lyase family protein [Scytonema sp. NUACC26]|uniref:lyase family protein n=1 Tax=Scytonema sp. NUACC26 TaxID=3140176 RepID=UPI0038B2A569
MKPTAWVKLKFRATNSGERKRARSLEHFSIGDDLIPPEMIVAYAVLKKAAAIVNHQAGRLGDEQKHLICQVCDEILSGQHRDQFPLHVWMTGSGTQFNMNVQRSHFQSLLSISRKSTRQQDTCASERSREYVSVI